MKLTCVGQLIAMRKAMKNKLCHRVKVTVVDNYQGEENDIILLSLVRSNKEVCSRLELDNLLIIAAL